MRMLLSRNITKTTSILSFHEVSYSSYKTRQELSMIHITRESIHPLFMYECQVKVDTRWTR